MNDGLCAPGDEHRDDIESRLNNAELAKPSGRLDLNARLKYPDFEPAPKEAEEDKLDANRLVNGYCDPSAGLYNGSNPNNHERLFPSSDFPSTCHSNIFY